MKKNKYLLLWSSLGVLLLLGVAAVQENFFQEWRRLQRPLRSEGGAVDIRLRQVVIPPLRVADRCVSCHVGMGPGEQGLSGSKMALPHPPVVHDPAEFGCTVCHAGQGQATEREAAHGEVHFWPAPMIPRRFAYAGCGACHTHLKVPGTPRLEQGRAIFERYDCLACHRLEGRGGTVRPGAAGGMEGPDLSRAGYEGFDPAWYSKHLKAAVEGKSSAWRSGFGEIPEGERAELEGYIASRLGAPGLVEAKALFHSLGCRGCHKVEGVGGDDGPDLTRVGERDPGRLNLGQLPGEKSLAGWFAEHFRSPARLVPGSQMPALGLSESQIDRLVFYLLSLRRSGLPEAYWPKDRIQAERFGEREFAADGATVYSTFCAACHGAQGQGMRYPGMPAFPAIAHPDFLGLASDAFLAETVRRGRPGRRMPAWGENEGGLRSSEVIAVVAYLRELSGVPEPPTDPRPARWAQDPHDRGTSLYAAHCAGCHGAKGEGAEGPALRNPVLLESASDTYLVETVRRGRSGTSMEGFERPSSVRPALSPEESEAVVSFIRKWEVQKP